MEYLEFAAIGFVLVASLLVVYYCFCEYTTALRDQYQVEIKHRKSSDLFEIYDQIWNGDPADRGAAWFRTLGYLERNNYPKRMCREARVHLVTEERGDRRSSHVVTSNGRLIRVDQRGGDSKSEINDV